MSDQPPCCPICGRPQIVVGGEPVTTRDGSIAYDHLRSCSDFEEIAFFLLSPPIIQIAKAAGGRARAPR